MTAKARFYLLAAPLLCLSQLHAATTLQFSAAAYSVSESAGEIALAVQRLGDSTTGVTVDFATADQTATAGNKYTAVSGSLEFGPGETKKTIAVPILNGGIVEGSKSFRVALSNPTGGAALGSNSVATVSIADNDVGVEFQFTAYSVAEDAGQALVGISRRDDGSNPVSVTLATADLSATSGIDYSGTTNVLFFAPNERQKRVPISILNNAVKQPNRSFRVILSNPSGSTLGSAKSATVTIVDNDQGCEFETAVVQVVEDAGVALLKVTRGTDDIGSVFAVDVATADGTAKQGLDYTGFTNRLNFLSGEKSRQIAVPILNNGVKQVARTFRVGLSNPTGGTMGSRTNAAVSILDNDPGLGFETADYTNAWGKTEISVTVLRGADSSAGPLRVDFSTADLTAKAGEDFQAMTGSLEFQGNDAAKSLKIPILKPRSSSGGSKSFRISLSNPIGGATLGISVATVHILGAYLTISPPFDPNLAISRHPGWNLLTWDRGGQLQRSDLVDGPWQNLTNAQSPTAMESTSSAAFYRVANPRPADVYIPSSYDGNIPAPLVILLHGYGDLAVDTENYLQFLPLAEARGFLYCLPDGPADTVGNPFWNATDACCDFFNSGMDDAAYVRSLIEQISLQLAVDRKRVYVIGHSNGGFMAHRMACHSADLIAGIASVAGGAFLDPSACTPARLVNILHIHGTSDAIVPYWGGASVGFPSNLPQAPSVLQTISAWGQYNGSTGWSMDLAPTLDLSSDLAGFDTVVSRYTNSPPGGAVELWTINGGSHHPTFTSGFSTKVIDWLFAHAMP